MVFISLSLAVFTMLSRPLTLIESDGRGQNLVVMSPPHVLPLVDEDEDTQSGVHLFLCFYFLMIYKG